MYVTICKSNVYICIELCIMYGGGQSVRVGLMDLIPFGLLQPRPFMQQHF